MSNNIFIISDTHFGHESIIKFCDRPFATVKEMNEAMVDNWNKVIEKDDLVYHLGDVYFGYPELAGYYLAALKGRKRLVLGNHDHPNDPILTKHFEKIEMWYRKGNTIMTHVPMHEETWEIKDQKRLNLHGHTHLLKMTSPQFINVSVEHIAYTPKKLVDIEGVIV